MSFSWNLGGGGGSTGTPATGTTGFSFGGTTATPGGTQTGGTSLFGQPSTGTTTSSLFGAAPSSTTSTAGGSSLFGTPSAGSSSSLFGAAPSSTTSTSLFGTPSSTTATGTTSSLFGTPSSTTGTSSLFGTPTSSTGTSGSLFGTPAATTGGSLFGTPATTTQTSLWGTPAGGTAAANNAFLKPSTMTPQQAIQAIAASYGRESQFCRFTHIFYNLVHPSLVPKIQKPPHIDDRTWAQAQQDNPDPSRLVPVQARGFSDLKLRIQAQDKTAARHQEALQEVFAVLNEIQQKHELSTTVKVEEYKRRHMQLASRVLRIMKRLEVLRSMGYPILGDEEAFRGKLENLQRELNKPTQFKGRLNEITSFVRMQDDFAQETYEPLDEDSLGTIHEFLRQEQQGLSHLNEILKQDTKALDLMLQTMSNDETDNNK
ncbi:Nuclear pore complex protein Nup98-Nup96 [Balamuthia mandrillaris]